MKHAIPNLILRRCLGDNPTEEQPERKTTEKNGSTEEWRAKRNENDPAKEEQRRGKRAVRFDRRQEAKAERRSTGARKNRINGRAPVIEFRRG